MRWTLTPETLPWISDELGKDLKGSRWDAVTQEGLLVAFEIASETKKASGNFRSKFSFDKLTGNYWNWKTKGKTLTTNFWSTRKLETFSYHFASLICGDITKRCLPNVGLEFSLCCRVQVTLVFVTEARELFDSIWGTTWYYQEKTIEIQD